MWLFGYVGDTYYPSSQLGISSSSVVSIAQSLSSIAGTSNLRIVAAVDQEQGHNIQPQMIPTIKAYVDTLRRYSSVVYGRIDLEEFNTTSSVSLASEIALYANQLDLNGVWFDHSPAVYAAIGRSAFNSYMQNLANNYPSFNFLMDQSANTGGVYVTPEPGSTWGAHTYITPTTISGTDNQYSQGEISSLNSIYPGRVVMHYDAFAPSTTTPMSYFSIQSSSQEISAVDYLASQNSFTFIFPIIGSWTELTSQYHGDLYNSLSSGTYARSTYSAFVSAIQKYYITSQTPAQPAANLLAFPFLVLFGLAIPFAFTIADSKARLLKAGK